MASARPPAGRRPAAGGRRRRECGVRPDRDPGPHHHPRPQTAATVGREKLSRRYTLRATMLIATSTRAAWPARGRAGPRPRSRPRRRPAAGRRTASRCGSAVRTPASARRPRRPPPRRLGALASACRPSPCRLLLRLAGVDVDVLLAGEPHDLVHDLVGDRAQDVAVVLHALVAGEVEGLAEAHDRAGERAELLAGRGHHVGADAPPPGSPGRRSRARAGPRRSCRGRACRRGSGCPRGRCRTGRPPRGSCAPTSARPRRRWRPTGRSAPARHRRRTSSGTSP